MTQNIKNTKPKEEEVEKNKPASSSQNQTLTRGGATYQIRQINGLNVATRIS